MSLRSQLLGSIAIVLLATLLVGGLLTYRHAVNKIDTEMTAAIAVGSRIAHNAVDDAEEIVNPKRRLELLVADFDGDRHLQAFLIDSNKMIGAASRLQPPEELAPDWLAYLLDRKPERRTLKLPAIFAGLGDVVLQTDAQNEVGEVWSDVQLFMIILSIFCVASFGVVLVVLGRALEPLQKLMAAFGRIGSGDYEPRMAEQGPRELADLASGFNQMVVRLAYMEASNAQLMSQIETVQEEERSELARNLHDEVSPLLFCVDVDARSIRQLAEDRGSADVLAHASAIQDAVGTLKGSVKAILGDLRPSALHALSLRGFVEDLVEFWRPRRPGLDFSADVSSSGWGARIDDAVQAIVRESVSNAIKHSRARRIAIDVREDAGAVLVDVTDDGGGLRPSRSESGFGILGMSERAHKLGGTLEVRDEPGQGVRVRARIPIERPSSRQGVTPEAIYA